MLFKLIEHVIKIQSQGATVADADDAASISKAC